jgi:AbiTii
MKQLIKDITLGNISLAQALTRTKVLAYHLDNETFKSWIKKELEGYDYDDIHFPEYRKIGVVNYLTFVHGFQKYSNAVSINPGNPVYELVQFHRVLNSIPVLENLLKKVEHDPVQMDFRPEQAQALYELTVKKSFGERLLGGFMETGKASLENIIETTKQRLLDTLLSLEKALPDLTEDSVVEKSNLERVNNIVTTNIYGGNNPLNIATGINVEQKDISSTISPDFYQQLEQLGVNQKEVSSLKDIVESSSDDKNSLGGKIVKWLGSVSSSFVARGLYDKLPAITDFIHSHFFK